MLVYTGAIEDTHEVIQFFRRESPKLKMLRKVVITREKTAVYDVNNDTIEYPGLTYGSTTLEELLRELGVIFTAQTLHNPNATAGGTKEFVLSARWTWGHDRVL
jgi:hypothetical protein